MKTAFCSLLGAAVILAAGATTTLANDRYADMPPVMVSPDLSAPWVLQLGRAPGIVRPTRQATQPPLQRLFQAQPDRQRTAAVQQSARRMVMRPQINPIYLPQEVAYDGPAKPGTIVIDTHQNFLYLVERNGKARRYGVGTGKPGFEWAGTHKVTRKAEWPDWRPPAEMIAREHDKGHMIPAYMPGGPENPLGARALYLGSTLYRIHGTNQPWTIGQAVSSGCIRMRNEDVVELYERTGVGTKVVVM